ncbi:MAG: vanadium-dependent haloperoxidase [Actinomycetota bacterium]
MNGRRFRRIGLLVGMTVLVTGLTLPASFPAAAAEASDQVLAWNRYAYHELFVVKGQPPPVAFLNLAMMHAAMFDAVNAIDGGYEPYLGAPAGADPSDSKNAAAAEAAYRVLLAVVPSPSAQLTTDYTTSIAEITSAGETGIAGGQAVGQAAANAIIAARSGDNRTSPTAFTTGTGPGDWQAFSGNNFRWVANLNPFLIGEAEDFATKGPRSLGSAAYATEFNQVKSLGRKTGSTRTADQTNAALFWADNAAAMWSRIFQDLADEEDLSTVESSRFFGMLYLTGTDALIACFLDKELHAFWRPQTAIRNAGTDGNPDTTADAEWESLLVNPPYPDHPSGHNCVSSSIVKTLQDFFGTDVMSLGATSTATATIPAITRDFTSFSQVIKEIRKARVWGGLHFMSADAQGANLGRAVARYRQEHYFQPA